MKSLWTQLVRKTGGFVALRIAGGAASAIAAVWAARALGPHQLGISSLVIATVVQVALCFELLPSTVLIREFKTARTEDARFRLVGNASIARLCIAVLAVALTLTSATFSLIPREFVYPAGICTVLLTCRALAPAWIFQAEEKQLLLASVEVGAPIITLAAYVLFLKAGAKAWQDCLIQSLVAVTITTASWVALWKSSGFRPLRRNSNAIKAVGSLFYSGRWIAAMNLTIYGYAGLENVLVGYVGSVEMAGKYRTATSVSQAALILVNLPQVFLFPRFLEWLKVSPALVWKRQIQIASVVAPIAAGGGVASLLVIPTLHHWWFGARYSDAAMPTAVLVCSKMIVMINAVFVWGVAANHKNDRALLALMAVVALVSITSNIVLIPKFGLIGISCVNLVSESLVLIGAIYLSWRSCSCNGRHIYHSEHSENADRTTR